MFAHLSRNFEDLKNAYDFIIIGSGYGGAINAARLASADLDPKPSICLLERGKEWPVEDFPDSGVGVLQEIRRYPDAKGLASNPLGLFEFLTFDDLTVVKGSGLVGPGRASSGVLSGRFPKPRTCVRLSPL